MALLRTETLVDALADFMTFWAQHGLLPEVENNLRLWFCVLGEVPEWQDPPPVCVLFVFSIEGVEYECGPLWFNMFCKPFSGQNCFRLLGSTCHRIRPRKQRNPRKLH